MTDRPVPQLPPGILTQEQIDAISGGSCNTYEIIQAIDQLRNAYDSLVDFTSYVFERVSGS